MRSFSRGKTLDGFHINGLGNVEVFDQGFTGQTVAPVNAHGVGPTNTVGAAAAEAQRAIDFPLDFVQTVKNPVCGKHLHVKVLPVGLSVFFGVKPAKNERHREGGNNATSVGRQRRSATLVLPLHRWVVRNDNGFPVNGDVVFHIRRLGITGQIRHGVNQIFLIITVG
jgi:hypothetical protein